MTNSVNQALTDALQLGPSAGQHEAQKHSLDAFDWQHLSHYGLCCRHDGTQRAPFGRVKQALSRVVVLQRGDHTLRSINEGIQLFASHIKGCTQILSGLETVVRPPALPQAARPWADGPSFQGPADEVAPQGPTPPAPLLRIAGFV